jgi:hypothetical protein
MNIFLAILAATTSAIALGFAAAWFTTRIDRDNLQSDLDDLNADFLKQVEYADRLSLENDRAHFRIKALHDELHAVPDLPDPVAYMRDLVERFKRIGGGL